MFARRPDPQLVADLVATRAAPPPESAASAACSTIEELMAWQRVASWVESQRLDTMRRFTEARRATDLDLVSADAGPDIEALSPSERAAIERLEANLDAEAGKYAADEIALALNLSVASVDKQLALARDLAGVHRDLSEALELGQVSGFVAAMVAQATRKLPDDARRLIDAAVTADAMEQPPGRAIDAARARVSEVDRNADAATAAAMRNRRVFIKPLDDGVAMLGAILPAAEALRAYNSLDRSARSARRSGDPRTLDQLRSDRFGGLLGGDLRISEEPESAVGSMSADEPTKGKPLSVQVVISLSSLLGLDSKAAHLDGYGSLPAGAARDLIATGDSTLTGLICDSDTGAVLRADPTTYQPSTRLRHAIGCRDRHCRMPICSARVQHLDHIQSRLDSGLTTTDNLQGLCLRSHLTKHHPGWQVSGNADSAVTWTTPTGHRYTSMPPPATGPGTGPPRDPEPPGDTRRRRGEAA